MQKQPKIAWRQSQRQKLSQSVSKFNAKITRELKKNPDLAEFLPAKLNVKDLKKNITTAKELSTLIKSVDRLFKPGALMPITTDKGIKTTLYEIKEVKLKVNKINRARAKELKEVKPSTETGTMGSIQSNNLRPKKFNINKISPRDWGKYKAGIEIEAKDNFYSRKAELYKENYLKSIEFNLGSEGEELYNYVSELDPEFVYRNFYNDPILQIGFTSDALPANHIAETSLSHWKTAVANSIT